MPLLSKRFQRWPRPWRRLLWGVLALYALYLLAGNVFLNTALFNAATNRVPEKFRMQAGPALTLLPGHVIAWNVRMRGQANHTVYVLRADRVGGRIALWPLLRRELRIGHLQVTEVTADLSRVEWAIPPPPRGDRGWTLRFDAIHSDSLRRLRWGKLRIVGDGTATVGFLKQLKGGPSQLYASTLKFDDAEVGYGGLKLLQQGRIAAEFSYPRHYRDQAPGLRKLGILRAHLALQGRSLALKIDTGAAGVAVGTEPAQARVEADVRLAQGALQPGSRALWRFPLRAGVGATDRGMLALQLDVARDIRVQARLPRDPRSGSELHADLHLAGRAIPWESPRALLPRLSGQVRGRWPFESLNWISELFVRKPWFRLDGGGLVEADLRLSEGRLVPGSTLEVPRVEATAEMLDHRIHGIAAAQGRIVVTAGRPQARLDVRFPEFEVAPSDAPGQAFVHGQDLRLALAGDAELSRLRDSLQVRLSFADAQVPNLTAYNRYLPGNSLQWLSGSGRFSGDVELDASGEVGKGRARLRGSAARLALMGVEMQGDADLDISLRRADLGRQQFDLSGSRVSLRNLRLAGQTRPGEAGWATLALTRGHIAARKPYQVDADADLRMRDASVLLGLLAQHSDTPRWILGLADSGEVQATGTLRWRKDRVLLDRLHAENQRLSLRARLDVGQARRRGELYLRWGVLAAAIELEGQQRRWHLTGARQWYDSRPPLLPPAR